MTHISMRHLTPYIISGIVLFMVGCTESEEIIRDNDKINNWIYTTMQQKYLWASDIKPMLSENRDISPTVFFDKQIRYRHDRSVEYGKDTYGDRFSRIKYIGPTTRTAFDDSAATPKDMAYNFGFELRLMLNLSDMVAFCQVLYVLPGSPADKAGIRRGDRFNSLNGVKMPISRSQYTEIISSNRLKLHFSQPECTKELIKSDYYDTPIILDTVFETTPRVAYLVYNHFTTGDKERFNNQLNEAFRRFKAKNARSLILDLRYNGGGELIAARMLASLIARSDMLGKIFIYKEGCNSMGNPSAFESETFMHASSLNGNNCNMESIVILTSQNTASASELIIHALKPYYNNNMTVIGRQTVGKNIGGITITNKRYQWELHPITIRIYDCNKTSGYETGIKPDIVSDEFIDDYDDGYQIGQLGDIQREKLLSMAIARLSGSNATMQLEQTATTKSPTGLLHSQTTIRQRGLTTDHIVVE